MDTGAEVAAIVIIIALAVFFFISNREKGGKGYDVKGTKKSERKDNP